MVASNSICQRARNRRRLATLLMYRPSVRLLVIAQSQHCRILPAGLGEWASEQPEILAVPLVGSQAKGIARLDSGMNLVLIVSDPTGFFAGAERMKHFGHVRAFRDEDWGPLRSRRIHYASGLPARSQSTPNHFRGSVIPREPS